MFRCYFAFLRGAARVFDKDWGMSIYGQADQEVSLLGMTMAYDRGARYIWFWSSDRDHHLPFEEQLELAAGLSDHVRKHPRGERRALVHYKLYFALAGLIVFWIVYRTYRIVRWVRRRRAKLAGARV
jgi:hypothetical protein